MIFWALPTIGPTLPTADSTALNSTELLGTGIALDCLIRRKNAFLVNLLFMIALENLYNKL